MAMETVGGDSVAVLNDAGKRLPDRSPLYASPRPAVTTPAEVTDDVVRGAHERYLEGVREGIAMGVSHVSEDNQHKAMRAALLFAGAALAAQCQVRKDTQAMDDSNASLALEWANIHEAESNRYLVNQSLTNARRHREISQLLRNIALAAKRPAGVPAGYRALPIVPDRATLVRLSESMSIEPLSSDDYPITGKQSTVRQWYDALLAAAPEVGRG